MNNYWSRQITWSLLTREWKAKLVRGEALHTQFQPFFSFSNNFHTNRRKLHHRHCTLKSVNISGILLTLPGHSKWAKRWLDHAKYSCVQWQGPKIPVHLLAQAVSYFYYGKFNTSLARRKLLKPNVIKLFIFLNINTHAQDLKFCHCFRVQQMY